MKKYLIIAAAAALTLASCAKVENFSNKMNDGKMAISFSNYAPKALVKADTTNYVAGTQLKNGADFDVWAWYTANGVSFTGTTEPKYFTNWYTVNYNGDGAGTSGENNGYPDGARYWPTGDDPDYLHFYAYYPSNPGAGTITAPTAGLGDFTFTAADSAAVQVDFMIADVVVDQVYGATNASPTNKGTVNLKFRHQLTKVQVKFKTTQAICDDAKTQIKVDSAFFYKINNTGKLTTSYQKVDANGLIAGETGYDSASAVDSTATRWSAQSGTATYEIAVPADTLTVTAVNTNNVVRDAFLMVPQKMLANTEADAQYIHVYWTVTTDGIETHNNRKIYLDDCVNTDGGSTPADIDWLKNHFVTYIITIAPNQILFTGDAAEWDPEEFGYYRIF